MKKLFAVFLVAGFLSLGSSHLMARMPVSETANPKENAVKTIPIQKGETKKYGNYLTTCMFIAEKGNDNKLVVEYPVSGNPKLVNAIRKNIKEILDPDFKGTLKSPESLMRSVLKDKRDMKFGEEGESLNEEIKVIYSSPSVITFSNEGYSYMGGAHGMNWCAATTFLISDGTMFDISMLPPFSQMRPFIFKGLAEYFDTKVEDLKDYLFDPDDVGYPKSVAITDKGLTFYYQPYEIAAYAYGSPDAIVPITPQIVKMLTPAGRQFFK